MTKKTSNQNNLFVLSILEYNGGWQQNKEEYNGEKKMYELYFLEKSV